MTSFLLSGLLLAEVVVWRGETTAVRVESGAEWRPLPRGVTVRTGSLAAVRYAPNPKSDDRLAAFDRVTWGAAEKGTPCVAEIAVTPEAAPGSYDLGAVRLRVIDRILPPAREWKYYLDLWQHPWAVARTSGTRPFSPAHYAAMEPLWRLLATAGQKTVTTTIVPLPWDHQCFDGYGTMIRRIRREDGGWRFDYSVFDEYIAFAFRCGLGPDISCYTLCPWGPCRYENEKGEVKSVRLAPGSAEFEDFWGGFLEDFARHLKEKGWLGRTFIAMDERSVEDVRKIDAFVRRRAPGLKLAMAGNRLPSAYGRIESYCMLLGEALTPAFLTEAADRRRQGLVTTYYVALGPYHPNTFMDSPDDEAFWLGAYPAVCGLDGFLRWAWNSWPEDPLVDASHGRVLPAGDTFLVYPDGAPSWRFLRLRNGIVAAEKLRILSAMSPVFAERTKALGELFVRDEAIAGKSDFAAIRKAVLSVVNAE